MRNNAFLAIWSDVAAEHEVDYLHWLTREHTAERLGVEGFHSVRVYRSLRSDVRRYFIHYELATPAVLDGESYLSRLNAPTPWSQRIMPILGNFVRGGGQVSCTSGTGHGSVLAAIRLPAPPYPDAATVQSLTMKDLIVSANLLETDTGRTTVQTKEKGMRERDSSFAALLLVDGLTEQAVTDALEGVDLDKKAELFSQIFQL